MLDSITMKVHHAFGNRNEVLNYSLRLKEKYTKTNISKDENGIFKIAILYLTRKKSGNSLKVRVYPTEIIIENSLTSWYLGTNCHHLHHKEFCKAMECLSDNLMFKEHGIDIWNGEFERLHIGCNFNVTQSVAEVLTCLGMCPGAKRKELYTETIEYKFKGSESLLFYDKYAKQRDKKNTIPKEWKDKKWNVIRIECKFDKSIPVDLQPQSLKDPGNYAKAYGYIVEKYDQVEKHTRERLNMPEKQTASELVRSTLVQYMAKYGVDYQIITETEKLGKSKQNRSHYRKRIKALKARAALVGTVDIKELTKKVHNGQFIGAKDAIPAITEAIQGDSPAKKKEPHVMPPAPVKSYKQLIADFEWGGKKQAKNIANRKKNSTFVKQPDVTSRYIQAVTKHKDMETADNQSQRSSEIENMYACLKDYRASVRDMDESMKEMQRRLTVMRECMDNASAEIQLMVLN